MNVAPEGFSRTYSNVTQHSTLDESNITNLVETVSKKIIDENIKNVANQLMDILIGALTQVLNGMDTSNNPALSLMRDNLVSNLLNQPKGHILSLAKDALNQQQPNTKSSLNKVSNTLNPLNYVN